MKKIMKVALLGIAALTANAHAGVILQENSDAGTVINREVGQSFTAEDTNIRFGVRLWSANAHQPNGGVIFSLYEGDGLNGSLLYNTNLFPNIEGLGWNDFIFADFTSIDLNVGQMYTASIQDTLGESYWGTNFNRAKFAPGYDGGRMHSWHDDPSEYDLKFRIEPSGINDTAPTVEVSAPTTLGLLSLALVAAGLRRRYR
ncbi:PEP-CTERM sorting domain-containing protein [Alteromonas macleodii]|uniref:PEP-CTERM sorting domain-containing protein n=1 Tax=Alteromonas macleodii TaxID=28108 RepID=UPI0031403C63